ncbi:MAG: serine/threonine protein kinase [Deltaproteobacteria bacterium]|nr:serine/threonine protein kinase [Deltaproteobacteria bacterium]
MSRGRAGARAGAGAGAGGAGAGRQDPLLGQVIAGRYEVVRLLGKGGMGAVYEVRHQRLKRSFAMKTLTAGRADDGEALARFQREADVVATLRHANVVEVIDWEQLPDGAPCMIMELLRGEDLGERLERGPLPWPLLARIADQVLSALAAAHRAGIVHRDLKPQNIFLVEDDSGEVRAKLLDFGVSKIRDSAFKTTDDRLIGTPAYMSPEQANGESERIGPAADVWAMGAMLFEMATGRPAFKATSVPALLHRIAFGEPEALLPLRPDAPAPFVDLVAGALSRDAARRLTTTDELRAGLRVALGGVAPGVLRPLGAATEDDLVPSAPVQRPADTSNVRFGQPTTLSQAAGQTSGARARSTRRRWLGVGAVVTLLAAGAVVAVWQVRARGHRGAGESRSVGLPGAGGGTGSGASSGATSLAPSPPVAVVVTPVVTPVLAPDGAVARAAAPDAGQGETPSSSPSASPGRKHGKTQKPSPTASASPAASPSPTVTASPTPTPSPSPSKSPGTVIFDPYAKPSR